MVGIQIEYTGDAKVEKHVPAVSLNSLLGKLSTIHSSYRDPEYT